MPITGKKNENFRDKEKKGKKEKVPQQGLFEHSQSNKLMNKLMLFLSRQ